MIQPQELRIGNWIVGYDGNLFQWTLEHFELIAHHCSIDELIKSGVELTPEILVKCGFVLSKDGYYWKTWGSNGLIIIKWDEYYNAFKIELGKCHYKVLSSLHELQNGFYFLTSGEELNSKP